MRAPAEYDDDLGSLQFADVRAYYQSAGNDPTSLARALLARISAQAAANVWITPPDEDGLLATAADLVRRWPDAAARPRLWGIPIAVKDNVDVRGWPTTAGCPDYAYQPDESAELVHRLVDAGALIVGKTNMDQFASGLTGARSAYGICRSPFDRDFIAGGSSSGSALAVSLGLAAAAIGTDTAGSGRVPAAFTNTVGLKPSRGLVSARGLVPACRSLDCPSVFALSVADASAVLAVVAGRDRRDPWSRSLPVPPAGPVQILGRARIGIADLSGESVDDATRAAYAGALEVLAATGAELVPVDISPLRAAGDLLYDGPWVAERLTELEPWIDAHPTSLLPVTATVLASGRTKLAVDAFRGFHRLAELVAELEPTWSAVDAIVLPTVASTPTVAETLADPHRMNTRMGQYTMFANLLDLAAIAAPASFDQGTGRPAGVTFYAPAGQDGRLASLAAQFQDATGLLAGSTQYPVRLAAMGEPSEADVLVAVVGAHRSGQPLNGQLVALGARSVAITLTAAAYRLFALPTSSIDPIQRPGLVRVNENGESIEVELFGLPVDALGRFLLTIPAPLGLGLIELVDGTRVTGFLCEAVAIEGALDISDYKSWVNFVAEGPRT